MHRFLHNKHLLMNMYVTNISLLYRESYYRAKYSFTVNVECGHLLGLDVSNIFKFK